ncbi:MarR family winged helix-turn-helix transcriptional regulator [Salipiger abyssi]|uniref:MarR family winged helix-turn-helix transcriptional regulator n=1 Tax=Salipiger abyssi TaxID=1250539 RepID=UPI001A8C18D0|nr:MarR family winged helix-turn-helix transcriptional regulator [Salipiger abyssi]MBN9889330.1 winged helix-turn-helix transcriptional regulator [Salipiger abyssi]
MDRTDSIERIGGGLVQMKLMIGRRVIGRTAMANQAATMEVSALDALSIVPGAEEGQGVMINEIAKAMRVDQSRASRLVSTLVGHGLVERRVSSNDARRALVVRTARGSEMLAEIAQLRNALISEVISDWSDEDAERFSKLMIRFLDAFNAGLSELEQD